MNIDLIVAIATVVAIGLGLLISVIRYKNEDINKKR